MGIRTSFNPFGIGETNNNSFVYIVSVDSSNLTVAVPIVHYDANMPVNIDWGDGSSNLNDDNRQSIESYSFPCHQYAKSGDYTITLTSESDRMPYLKFGATSLTRSTLKRLEYCGVGFYFGGSEVTDVMGMFADCTNLIGGIPSTLFTKTPKIKTFHNVFYNCSSLTDAIPANLFSNNTDATDFSGVFWECRNIKHPIPRGLFSNNKKATTFQNLFYNCVELTGGIPADLFSNCPDVTTFASVFCNCHNLSGDIPELLFANNKKATQFTSCFRLVPMILNKNIFCNEDSEKETRFAGQVINFTQAFMRNDSLNNAEYGVGVAPSLWDYKTSKTTKTRCFNCCSNVISNYAEAMAKNWV